MERDGTGEGEAVFAATAGKAQNDGHSDQKSLLHCLSATKWISLGRLLTSAARRQCKQLVRKQGRKRLRLRLHPWLLRNGEHLLRVPIVGQAVRTGGELRVQFATSNALIHADAFRYFTARRIPP